MHLALATCSNLPAHERDDRPFRAALSARGVRVTEPVWSDPGVDWGAFDAVLIRTTWDYQEHLARFLAWADGVAAVTRLFNSAAVVRWNTHKGYLRALEARGVPIVPTHWLARGSRAELGALVAALPVDGADRAGAEAFLKPCIGATARETLRFARDRHGLERAQAHVDRLLPAEDLMLQPFLRNVTERGEWSAIFLGGRISHCVRKVPVAGDYRVQDDFGAHDEPYSPTAAERAAAEHAMRTAEELLAERLLYGRTDWLWRADGGCALTELELVEPSLFFRHGPHAAGALADALLAAAAGSDRSH